MSGLFETGDSAWDKVVALGGVTPGELSARNKVLATVRLGNDVLPLPSPDALKSARLGEEMVGFDFSGMALVSEMPAESEPKEK